MFHMLCKRLLDNTPVRFSTLKNWELFILDDVLKAFQKTVDVLFSGRSDEEKILGLIGLIKDGSLFFVIV